MSNSTLPNGVIQNRTLDADNDMNKSCMKYTKTPVNKKEAKRFEQKYIPKLTDKTNQQLQMNLTGSQVSDLLDACAFQIAFGMNPNESICSLFNSDDFTDYQLDDDFIKYYSLSYGLAPPFNTNLACSLLTGITSNVLNQSMTASFHFGHAETIIPLVSSLGLFQDSILTNDETGEQLDGRQFKTGLIAPMQANIVFEVYENKDIRVVLNEIPVSLPGCSELCPFDSFLQIYKHVIGCDFDSICENTATTIGGSNSQ
ncbi:PHOsphatase [Terramyces sp. JEL0728]|nr:PHOsphatase [Terramyces sp. JEL0728]